MVIVVAGTVSVTMATRKIPVQIPRKVMGRGRIRAGAEVFVPLRLNSAGVMPIIFAQSIIIVPATLAQFSDSRFAKEIAQWFQYGTWPYYLTFTVLIVFFTYFYTAIIFNPVDLAENLKKQGAFVPGVKPGARTAEYIDRVMSRISLPGSLFLAAIAIVPFMLLDARWCRVPCERAGRHRSADRASASPSTRCSRCSSTCCCVATTAS